MVQGSGNKEQDRDADDGAELPRVDSPPYFEVHSLVKGTSRHTRLFTHIRLGDAFLSVNLFCLPRVATNLAALAEATG